MRKVIVMVLSLFALLSVLAFSDSESLTINASSDVLMCGYSINLEARLGNDKVKAAWTSDNPELVLLKSTGEMRVKTSLKSAAKVTVTATSNGKEASIEITIAPQVDHYTMGCNGMNYAGKLIQLGETPVQLTAMCSIPDAALAAEWVSTNEKVAIVDRNGLVTAVGSGKCEIRAAAPSGRYTNCYVEVNIPAESITLVAPTLIPIGSTADIMCFVEPEAAQNGSFTYTSSDSKVVKVSSNGKLTPVSSGKAVITCSASNGVSGSCSVEVYRKVDSIKSNINYTTVGIGSQKQLSFTVSPQTARYSRLEYSSSDESIATVDRNGLVTVIGQGTCRITAQNSEGKSAYTTINAVFVELTGAQFGSSFVSMNLGETFSPAIVFAPEDASDKSCVVIVSSDESVVSVSGNKLTANTPGRANISIIKDGKILDSTNVRVLSDSSLPLEGIKIGVNPGHQISLNLSQKPLYPGASKTGNANSGYAIGIRTRTREYDVTLNVGLHLRDLLEELGAEVVMTRTENDVHIDNIERAQMLNEAGVDFAIQLHCDNNPDDHSKTGMSMFVKPRDYESYEIAEKILSNTTAYCAARNLHVRWYSNYMSLNWSTTPTALIEMGYLSTEADDLKLSNPDYQKQVAQGICNGIVEYYCGKAE